MIFFSILRPLRKAIFKKKNCGSGLGGRKKRFVRILTLSSISFTLFALLIGALTFGSDREINAEVAAIKFVLRVDVEDDVCDTYKIYRDIHTFIYIYFEFYHMRASCDARISHEYRQRKKMQVYKNLLILIFLNKKL